jgi:hypothetical protein
MFRCHYCGKIMWPWQTLFKDLYWVHLKCYSQSVMEYWVGMYNHGAPEAYKIILDAQETPK